MADSTTTDTDARPQGALLSDAQIARLRWAVIVMTVLLVAGIATLIGRVMYLASGARENPSGLVSEATLTLPEGATLRGTALSGARLTAHYTGSGGDGVLVLDLATGKTISHVRVTK